MSDRKINVLVVARWPVGGIRTYMRYVYSNFTAAKYDVALLAPNYPETRVLLKDLDTLNVNYVEVEENPSFSDFAKRIFIALRNKKFDIIHAHGLTAGIYSIFPSIVFRVPLLVTIHDVFLENQFKGKGGFIKKVALSILMPLITKIHAVGNDTKDNIYQYVPVLKLCREKVVAIRNGIDVKRFGCPEKRDFRRELGLDKDTYLIGFLGRFMSQKGFQYLIDALVLLNGKKELPAKPVILTFGEGAFIREEQVAIIAKGLQDQVYFLPFVANVASSLKGLDVVAMPSLWEACALQPMETMVAGIPFIGTNCIGLREVLEDTPCRMVLPKNSEALAEAIAHEIKNPSKKIAEEFKNEAMRRFDVTNHSRELEQLMKNMMKTTSHDTAIKDTQCAE